MGREWADPPFVLLVYPTGIETIFNNLDFQRMALLPRKHTSSQKAQAQRSNQLASQLPPLSPLPARGSSTLPTEAWRFLKTTPRPRAQEPESPIPPVDVQQTHHDCCWWILKARPTQEGNKRAPRKVQEVGILELPLKRKAGHLVDSWWV